VDFDSVAIGLFGQSFEHILNAIYRGIDITILDVDISKNYP
jgi:hypothetical protein